MFSDSLKAFTAQLNEWGTRKTPFLFVIDFELKKPFACVLQNAAQEDIFFNIRGKRNYRSDTVDTSIDIHGVSPSFTDFERKFDIVSKHLHYGDSFLTNLTMKSRITSASSLPEIFHAAKSRYKLMFKNQFIVFSPETFIRIENGHIVANPMKGTIDADTADAEQTLLNNEKERAEHITIVDLIRNDLSLVAEDVAVSRFRYLEKLITTKKDLLQMSSEITGRLPRDFASRVGDILVSLLPAGSVSGAPKAKTIDIIAKAEGEPRGYYTGIFGYFDGDILDSGVMIRFIENEGDQLFYRSGGGITAQSNVHDEYQEMIDKIYVPLD